jgi:RNA polymerase sigma factor (sigma-70 family)
LLESLPGLRVFALSLLHNVHQADDLMKGTNLRAWENFDHFERGSNVGAWLVTILRNLVRSEYRRRKREVENPDGSYAAQMRSLPEQQSHLDYEVVKVALTKLPFTGGPTSLRAHTITTMPSSLRRSLGSTKRFGWRHLSALLRALRQQ